MLYVSTTAYFIFVVVVLLNLSATNSFPVFPTTFFFHWKSDSLFLRTLTSFSRKRNPFFGIPHSSLHSKRSQVQKLQDVSAVVSLQSQPNYNDESISEYGQPPVIPITVISGFLGAGKTTLLQNLLTNREGLRIAVIVNDVASMNIDSKLFVSSQHRDQTIVAEDGEDLDEKRNSVQFLELQNGCACCSQSDELLSSVAELVTLHDLRSSGVQYEYDEDHDEHNERTHVMLGGFDHIVIEMSGVGDPAAVRQLFQDAIMFDMPLMERVRLDTMVTVIDVMTFLPTMMTANSPVSDPNYDRQEYFDKNRKENDMDDTVFDSTLSVPHSFRGLLDESYNDDEESISNTREVAALLTSQTEVADLIVLNKIDLLLLSKDRQHDPQIENVILGVTNDENNRELTAVRELVHAINPKANVVETEFGQLPIHVVLASATSYKNINNNDYSGVARLGILDHHRDSVQLATRSTTISTTKQQQTKDIDKATAIVPVTWIETDCTSPADGEYNKCDKNHDHSHNIHSSQTIDSTVCSSLGCTDPTHDHSHGHHHHDNATHMQQQQLQHTKSTTATNHAGIGTMVYKARRPFHPNRLLHKVLRQLPIRFGLGDTWSLSLNRTTTANTEISSTKDNETAILWKRVIRSKGFAWFANSHAAALYWSQAGVCYDVSCLGAWWATLRDRSMLSSNAIESILSDYDNIHHVDDDKSTYRHSNEGCDNVTVTVGDRRQELVLIGPSIGDPNHQSIISNILDQCLLTDDEWLLYLQHRYDEKVLSQLFPVPNDITIRTAATLY